MDILISLQTTLDKTPELANMVNWYTNYSLFDIDELIANDEIDKVLTWDNYNKITVFNTDTGLYMATNRNMFDSDDVMRNVLKKKLNLPEGLNINYIQGELAVKFITRILDKLPFDIRVKFLQYSILNTGRYDSVISSLGGFLNKYVKELETIILGEDKCCHIMLGRTVTDYDIKISDEAREELSKYINRVAQINVPMSISPNLIPYLNDVSLDYINATRTIVNAITNKPKQFNDNISNRPLVIYDDDESLRVYVDAMNKSFPNMDYSSNKDMIDMIDRVLDLGNDIITGILISRLKTKREIRILPFMTSSKLPYPNELYRLKSNTNPDNDWWDYVLKVVKDKNLDMPEIEKFKVATNKENMLITQLSEYNYRLVYDILSIYTDPSQLDMQFTETVLTDFLWYRADGIDDVRKMIHEYRPMSCKEVQDIVIKALLTAIGRLRRDSCKKLIRSLAYTIRADNVILIGDTYIRDNRDVLDYITEMAEGMDKITGVICNMILEGDEV